jgi:Concanavalin A-like lectin/glucanases superfamily
LPRLSCMDDYTCGFLQAMSEQATNTNAFGLGYDGSCQCWAFYMPSSDNADATVYEAESQPLTQSGYSNWTQLTGVYDAHYQTLTLYVNGALAETVTGVGRWGSPGIGPLSLGLGSLGFWPGYLSDACAFYGALASSDVSNLYVPGGDGCAALYQTYP